jgi:hypothetical protein
MYRQAREMTGKKNHSVFIVLFCCFLLPSGILVSPASAGNTGATLITAKISLTAFDIAATAVGQSLATITWKTNGNADSTVEYGLTTGYGSTQTNPFMETNHTITLSGLAPGTLYHWRVVSSDQDGNRYVSTDYTFRTLPDYVPGGGGGSAPGQNISSGITSIDTTPMPTIDTTLMPMVTGNSTTTAPVPAGTVLPVQTAAFPAPVGSMQWAIIFSTFIIIVAAGAGYYFVTKKK